ncbi:hypothetical protein G4G28_11835 [Massilia sp. Dwa41.01b]|uniref:hypothetical protein n=1 Tax=unclassified Massilia TaxID=2609279 RepID=UPI001602D53F|nr:MULTISPECIES: hypothetical protein [unclassified Massilia]QNA88997.1 hypothetical protein G4G28_11835 [Massilia sp. Dwa41.01b]QNA99889.1 hypothetical protein G4G31_15465 [Massilia sp. Se16.2.3]
MHEKRVARIYHRELFGAIALYALILGVAIHVGRPMAPGALRTLILLSPMIGFAAAIWAIVRQVGRVDEFVRMRLLENVALSAALTAGLTFSYGFLEIAGYPKLSMFSVWCVLCGGTGVVGIVRKLAGR